VACILNIVSAIKNSQRIDLTEEERSHGENLEYGALIQQVLGFYIMFSIIYIGATYGDNDIMQT
jgi:large-conductance mechanosensitive channel